jgi:hypothetical protein
MKALFHHNKINAQRCKTRYAALLMRGRRT